MSDANLFKNLELEAFRAGITPRTDESRQWFRTKLQQLRRVNRLELMRSDEVELVNKSRPLIGTMNMISMIRKQKIHYHSMIDSL